MQKIVVMFGFFLQPFILSAHPDYDDAGDCMWSWPFRNFHYGGIIMWIIVIIIVALIWYFVVKEKGSISLNNPSALDILKKRYAKGEITKKEFDEMKKDLV